MYMRCYETLFFTFEDDVIKQFLTDIVYPFIYLHYLKVITARHVIGDRVILGNPVNDYSPFLLAFKQFITIIETMQSRIFESWKWNIFCSSLFLSESSFEMPSPNACCNPINHIFAFWRSSPTILTPHQTK